MRLSFRRKVQAQEIYTFSQRQLVWFKFRRHKAAVVSMYVLAALYLVTIMAQFISPYPMNERSSRIYQPPQKIRFLSEQGLRLRPFVYALKEARDPVTMAKVYEECFRPGFT